jgi:hypothetical protein
MLCNYCQTNISLNHNAVIAREQLVRQKLELEDNPHVHGCELRCQWTCWPRWSAVGALIFPFNF